MKSTIEATPEGQRRTIEAIWRDVHSTDMTDREWAWRELVGIGRFLDSGPCPNQDLSEELYLLRALALLMVRSPEMEG